MEETSGKLLWDMFCSVGKLFWNAFCNVMKGLFIPLFFVVIKLVCLWLFFWAVFTYPLPSIAVFVFLIYLKN